MCETPSVWSSVAGPSRPGHKHEEGRVGGEAANPVSPGTGWWGPTQGSVDRPESGATATTATVLLLQRFLEPRALKICWALASARVSIRPVPLGRPCRLRALVSLSDPKAQARQTHGTGLTHVPCVGLSGRWSCSPVQSQASGQRRRVRSDRARLSHPMSTRQRQRLDLVWSPISPLCAQRQF